MNNRSQHHNDPACPRCEHHGKNVSYTTLHAQLLDNAKKRLPFNASENNEKNHDAKQIKAPFRFCKTPQCNVVYYGSPSSSPSDSAQSLFTTTDLAVTVFQKSQDPTRLVCYCFSHSVQELQGKTAPNNNTIISSSITEHHTDERNVVAPSITESIGQKCKAGLDRCEEMNPQGSCCLANVRAVIKTGSIDVSIATVTDSHADPDHDNCCAKSGHQNYYENTANLATDNAKSSLKNITKSNVGGWSAGGALLAAILSSACCWLPLALVGFGVSAAGIASFFEAYRALFLAITAVLLGGGFYYVYFRIATCAPGDACAVPNVKLRRFNKISLWLVTIFVILFATFPNYIGAILGGDDEPPPLPTSTLPP